MRSKLWKWIFVSLKYAYYTIIAKVYQASCSGLECVYHQPLFSLSCCISLDPVNWFTFFSRSRCYLFPLSTSGGRMKRWAVLPLGEQCSLLVPQWRFHTWVRVIRIFSTRMHTLVCTRFLLSMSVTSLCSPLGSNPAWQWSLKTILILLRIAPFDCTNFWLQTATFKILINDKLPPGGSFLAA